MPAIPNAVEMRGLAMPKVLRRARIVAILLLATTVVAQEMPKNQPAVWANKPDIAAFEKMENDRLAAAQASIDQIVAVKGPEPSITRSRPTTKRCGS